MAHQAICLETLQDSKGLKNKKKRKRENQEKQRYTKLLTLFLCWENAQKCKQSMVTYLATTIKNPYAPNNKNLKYMK